MRDLQDRIDAQHPSPLFSLARPFAVFGDRSVELTASGALPSRRIATGPVRYGGACRPQSHEQLSGVSQKQHSHLDIIYFAYAS